MKKISKILIALLAFAMVQTVVAILLFIGFKVDITKQYRKGVEYNFSKIVEIILEKTENGEEPSLENVFIYNFDNVLIIERDSYIKNLARESTAFKPGNAFGVSIDFGVVFSASGSKEFETEVAGQSSVIYTYCLGDLALVAYESLAAEDALLNGFKFRLAMVSLVEMGLILCASLIFMGTSADKRLGRSINFSQGTMSNRNFIFRIDHKGRVLPKKKDRFTECYGIENISDFCADNDLSISKALSTKAPFSLLLTDKEGVKSFFRCIAARAVMGYKILAIEDSNFMNEYKTASEQFYIEPLTGLRNEHAIKRDLAQSFSEGKRYTEVSIAIFKIRNIENLASLFGSDVKEKTLKNCANMFRERYNDSSRVYFIGGDKFIILSNTEESTESVKQSLSAFIQKLSSIMKSDRNNLQVLVDATFFYIDFAEELALEEIIEYQEYLRLNLKGRIKTDIISEIITKNKYRHTIGNKKEMAVDIIEKGNFKVFYQPQFRIKDDKLVSFEALLRLDGSMTTEELILISEANGFMLRLGEQIIQKVFEFAARIREYKVPISINLSPVQLSNSGFVDRFLKSYEEHNLDRNCIGFEITETYLTRDVTENIKKLQIIHDNGIHLHLDDFGMGYSSLAYLKNFPIDTIKIDRAFVKEIDTDDHSKAICRFIISTAKQLKMETIAEGVETLAQFNCLKEIGCDIIQGYYKSKAIDEESAIELIKRSRGKV